MADILKLMTSFLFVLTVIYTALEAISSYDTNGCYQPEGSRCAIHNLTCPENTRINLGFLSYYSIPSMATCSLIQDEAECKTRPCCKKTRGDQLMGSMSPPDSLVVYKACSLQQSCSITSPYEQDTGYNYIDYGYYCMNDSLIHNILTTGTILGHGLILYYNGKKSPVNGLSCSCNITNAEYVGINYMYLSNESCNKVIVPRTDLYGNTCKDSGILRFDQSVYNYKYRSRIVFNNMTSNKDDEIVMLYTGVGRRDVAASCDCNKAVMGGGWSNWSEYSACSVSCGEGIYIRRRECDQPEPTNGGSNCVGNATQSTACKHTEECPVDYGQILTRIGFVLVIVIILIFVIIWFRRRNRNTNIATSEQNEPSVHYESTAEVPSDVSPQYTSLSNTGEYITVF